MRGIPSIDALLRQATEQGITYPRDLLVDALRQAAARCRHQTPVPDQPADWILLLATHTLEDLFGASLRRVVNATGVVLHTNLGRSLLAPQAINAVTGVASYYSNLEFDLESGARGSRHTHVEGLLKRLTGAPAALVVNNCAAAVLLVLDEFGRGREVVVSRGELVEIGGSFRLPDVLRRSGARVIEVGTTNKTRLSDYEQVVGASTGLLLKSHRSNFRQSGFVAEADPGALSALGRRFGIPVAMDLGSGLLLDLARVGLAGEPTVRDIVETGVGLVCFSGDKLLGGPQAGIVVGDKPLIQRCRRNPLMRALRVDKLTLAALEATLRLYLTPEAAWSDIPTLRMLNQSVDQLSQRAQDLHQRLVPLLASQARLEVRDGVSEVGGGTLAVRPLPTVGVAVHPADDAESEWETRLRRHTPAILTRVQRGGLWMDVRTLQAQDNLRIEDAVRKVIATSL